MDGFVVIVRDFEGNNIDWGIVPNSVTEQIEKIDIELIIADIEILSNKVALMDYLVDLLIEKETIEAEDVINSLKSFKSYRCSMFWDLSGWFSMLFLV